MWAGPALHTAPIPGVGKQEAWSVVVEVEGGHCHLPRPDQPHRSDPLPKRRTRFGRLFSFCFYLRDADGRPTVPAPEDQPAVERDPGQRRPSKWPAVCA